MIPTVFVVDDDASVQQALQRLFLSVGLRCETFGSASAFLTRASTGVTGCLVLDIRMPEVSGLDLQRMLASTEQDLPIVFVTAHADVPLAVRAMKAGALEVLTKPADDQVLIDAVNQAFQQGRSRSEERSYLRQLQERLETLTNRERDVMWCTVSGKINKQTAAELGTSEKTVKAHRARVMHKMQAESLAGLVLMAYRLRASIEQRPHTPYGKSPKS